MHCNDVLGYYTVTYLDICEAYRSLVNCDQILYISKLLSVTVTVTCCMHRELHVYTVAEADILS